MGIFWGVYRIGISDVRFLGFTEIHTRLCEGRCGRINSVVIQIGGIMNLFTPAHNVHGNFAFVRSRMPIDFQRLAFFLTQNAI